MKKFTFTGTVVAPGSTSAGSAVFCPLTPPMPTVDITAAKFEVEFLHDDDIEVTPGVQYGDTPLVYGDGSLTWDAAVKPNGTITWLSTDTAPAWVYLDNYLSCPGDFGTSQADRGFLRFGLWVKNRSGGTATSDILTTSVRLRIRIKPVVGGSASGGPRAVPAVGSATRLFTPLTQALPLAQMAKVRVSWEVDASVGTVSVVPGCEVSADGKTWEAPPQDLATVVSATARTSDGVTFGTAFYPLDDGAGTPVPFRDTYQYIRFGVSAKNAAESGNPSVFVASVKVDWRDA